MIIVDGYNVVYKWKCLRRFKDDIDLALSKLINVLANYQGYTGEEIIIVLDSSAEREVRYSDITPQNITVIYAPNDMGADIYIERIVGLNKNPRNITVVTGDSLQRTAVIGKGAHTISPEKFEEQVRQKEAL